MTKPLRSPPLCCLIWLSLMGYSLVAAQQAPTLNGQHFRISGLEEPGFLDATEETDGSVSFSGYLIDMLDAIAIRAGFTYDILPPSGYGSLCSPQLGVADTPDDAPDRYDRSYRTQYNCGASDVNDFPLGNHSTDMYLGMYYVNPSRQLQNQFTIPFNPPFSGTLGMFGTATGIRDFPDLVEQQALGIAPVACAPGGSALVDEVAASYPGMQIKGFFGGEEDILRAMESGECEIYITDGPLASSFVLRRYQQEQCLANGKPIGTIGEPMGFGLSHYSIGIRRDIPASVVTAISYWMSILMTCNPLDKNGPCPDGNLATFYEGRGGTGSECGYVLFPQDKSLPPLAIVAVVVGSVVFAVLLVVAWHRWKIRRQKRAYAKKAAVAREQAIRDQELNEFLAHEVRNPLAAAIAATSFVMTKAKDPKVITSKKKRKKIISDIKVIDSSLLFVSDLMRNMLDLGRGEQLNLNIVTTDILKDIFEPVASILLMLGTKIEIQTVCPENLFIETDRMRLKQIVLNLATNSTKFVEEGYIRLRAEVKADHSDSTVYLSIEDSGPGIPVNKRNRLFTKFQQKIDLMNQGTGIELCLCQTLSNMLGFNLYLDESYRSDVPNCPGAGFTIQTNRLPMQLETALEALHDAEPSMSGVTLPESLVVLYVDDDVVIRKMVARALIRAAPTWTVKEASNGETAIRMAGHENFDLIFMDHYMAGVERQMLGTVAVRTLRAKGVTSVICGLSANDRKNEFLEAGADGFLQKPFPADKRGLQTELAKLLGPQGGYAKRPHDQPASHSSYASSQS